MPATECVFSYLRAFCVHESSYIAACLDTECVLGRTDAFCVQRSVLRSRFSHTRVAFSFVMTGPERQFVHLRSAALWVFVPVAEKCTWPENPPAPLRLSATELNVRQEFDIGHRMRYYLFTRILCPRIKSFRHLSGHRMCFRSSRCILCPTHRTLRTRFRHARY